MIEYEHSFQVRDWKAAIDYCQKHGYKLIEDFKQTRKVFSNSSNKINARITINEQNGQTTKFLDFKQNTLNIKKYRGKKESMELPYTDDAVVESILEILKYKPASVVKRFRKTYEKDDVKFEIDHYFEPYDKFVVAIEGEKEIVEKMFNNLKDEFGIVEQNRDK